MKLPDGRLYLDYAASHPLLPPVIDCFKGYLENPSNIQSSHSGGAEHSYHELDLKDQLVQYYQCMFTPRLTSANVILTSSGSMANKAILERVASQYQKKIFYPFFTHASVGKTPMLSEEIPSMAFTGLNLLPANYKQVEGQIYVHTPINSISGELASSPIFEKDTWVHIDDTQGLKKVAPLPFKNVKSISVSGHKIGAPAGIGAIIIENTDIAKLTEKVYGGGTANPWLIAGFSQAMACFPKYQKHEEYEKWFLKLYASEFENMGKWRILSTKANSGNCCICLLAVKRPKGAIPGLNHTVQFLSNEGILVSETSACSSKVSQEVLDHYSVNPMEEDIVRVSWGCFTKEEDINRLILNLKAAVNG